MEILDNRKADNLITWDEIEQGQVFADAAETEYPTYYMKVKSACCISEYYVDLEDGILYNYMGPEAIPRYKILNAEMQIND